MQILLCAATKLEIAPMIEKIQKKEIENVEVLITGVGLLASAYSITRTVLEKKPDLLVQAGISGCLDPNFPLSSVVFIENETLGDLGVDENGNFRSVFDLKLLGLDEWPWTDGKLRNPLDKKLMNNVKVVDGVTVNEISTGDAVINYYRDRLGAVSESMEGAALHYVGLKEKIPFIQLRSLSNFAGERDKKKWKMQESIGLLNHELEGLILKL
ncbi:MAG: futalosine hydrolase [Flavisolibacter sp.]